jgi:hypothetical protein
MQRSCADVNSPYKRKCGLTRGVLVNSLLCFKPQFGLHRYSISCICNSVFSDWKFFSMSWFFRLYIIGECKTKGKYLVIWLYLYFFCGWLVCKGALCRWGYFCCPTENSRHLEAYAVQKGEGISKKNSEKSYNFGEIIQKLYSLWKWAKPSRHS